MDTLNPAILTELMGGGASPCLSLYQPTHRSAPENQQDPIRYRNLLKELEASLAQAYRGRDVKPLLARFRELADDTSFWRHTGDGLAVLGSADRFHVFRLQRPVPELVVAADSFHLKPLVRVLQNADRYQVLGLSGHSIRFFEGNRDAMGEVDLRPKVPHTLEEAFGEDLNTLHDAVKAYGGPSTPGIPEVYHAHGGRRDPVDIEPEVFFRVIDRAILEHQSRPSGLPLVLVALAEHHSLFHKLSQNPFLMSESIAIDPMALKPDAIRERVWKLVEPSYEHRLAKLLEEYGGAQSRGLGTDDFDEAAVAGLAGRIKTLLVEADREVPGSINTTTGVVTRGKLANPHTDDLLDDLAEITMKAGGEVLIVPKDRMPGPSELAAIYRF